MVVALDTFLVALYVTVADRYRAYAQPARPCRPGRHAAMADSAVKC